ncbi:MAG: hypothetical protein WDO74_35340 [Pseudomonadota bacterium]
MFACGPSSDSPPAAVAGATAVAGAADSNTQGGGGAATATGGAAPNSGGHPGAGGASGDRGAPDFIGNVQVVRALPGAARAAATFDFVEQAAWDALAASAPTNTCAQQTHGDCVVTTCSTTSEMTSESSNPPSVVRLDAGTITISSDTDEFSATGTPTGSNGAYVFQAGGALGGGGMLTVSATGGTVPAFTGTFPLPLAPLLLAPSIDGLNGTIDISVSRTADFSIRWDARGASDEIQVVVTKPDDAGTWPVLNCHFAAAAGMATFPTGALAQMPAGTRFRLLGVNRRTLETAKGPLQLIGAYEMVSSDKMSYPSLVLQ